MTLLTFDWGTFAIGAVPAVVALVGAVIAIIKAIKGGKKWYQATLDEKDKFIEIYKQISAAIKSAKKASDSGQVAHKLLLENVDEKILGKLDTETKKQLDIAAAPIQDIVNEELAKNGVQDDDKLKVLVNAVNSGASANEAWKKWVEVGGTVATTAVKVAL